MGTAKYKTILDFLKIRGFFVGLRDGLLEGMPADVASSGAMNIVFELTNICKTADIFATFFE